MRVITTKKEVLEAVNEIKKKGLSVGFVPTMGALHKGHASLIKYALEYSDYVVVSIYVNPTQFNNSEDLKAYPRDPKSDIEFLSQFGDKILIYIPSSEEVYGSEITSTSYDFDGLENEMEGRFRPGHFEGVGTVLRLLFKSIMPDKAFFGEKDFQQLQIVKKLVEIEKLPIEIIGCPIYRAEDGLAESSRNKRLTEHHREIAPLIFKTLNQVKKDISSKSIPEINHWVESQFKKVEELDLEYFEIANVKTLKTSNEIVPEEKYRAFIAVFAGEVRLIDNIALN